MSARAEPAVIEATDLSPICDLAEDDEAWLRRLVQAADTCALALKFSPHDAIEVEPITFYDEKTACWWTGRYVGEVQYEGRTLRILPRFGMPQLQRWLSLIWGVRLISVNRHAIRTPFSG
jgi:5-methylcytosine-specific restriction enzyme subunit McrC